MLFDLEWSTSHWATAASGPEKSLKKMLANCSVKKTDARHKNRSREFLKGCCSTAPVLKDRTP